MTNSNNPHLKKAFELKNQEECRSLYKEWAPSYDTTMVDELKYVTPYKLSKYLAPELPDPTAPILDLGCGTGLVGEALQDIGYTNIDGLDFSKEMLRVSEQKDCYQDLMCADLTKKTQIPDRTYEAVICAGLFTHGHLDASCIDECLRIVQTDGLFASAIRAQTWKTMGFEKKFTNLESENQIELVKKDLLENYKDSKERDGVYVIFRIK